MFKTIVEVKEANKQSGNHFFDRATMRFFNSRIESRLYGGKYFVTSERFSPELRRRYTVREATENGNVKTVNGFQGCKTLEDARGQCRQLAKEARREPVS